jgi:hypothetical protein
VPSARVSRLRSGGGDVTLQTLGLRGQLSQPGEVQGRVQIAVLLVPAGPLRRGRCEFVTERLLREIEHQPMMPRAWVITRASFTPIINTQTILAACPMKFAAIPGLGGKSPRFEA